MPTLQILLEQAIETLKDCSPTPRLDAEVLLAWVLNKNRAYLRAHDDLVLSEAQRTHFSVLIEKRLSQVPVAYLIGYQEFWSLPIQVNQQVLIPRPETELLVELALQKLPADQPCVIADLGTGSGAIALALAHERPHWLVYAIDASQLALEVAMKNSELLKIKNITFLQGDWCHGLPTIRFDAIISNPPYIASDDPEWSESSRRYEPLNALVADQNGLRDLFMIISQAFDYLKDKGVLLLEHGYQQSEMLSKQLKARGYHHVEKYQDLAGLDRVVCAQYEIRQ